MPGTLPGAGITGMLRHLYAHRQREQNWMRAINVEPETVMSNS